MLFTSNENLLGAFERLMRRITDDDTITITATKDFQYVFCKSESAVLWEVTPTGLRKTMVGALSQWCEDNGVDLDYYIWGEGK